MNITKNPTLRERGETERMVENQQRLMELLSQDKQYGIWMGIFSEAKDAFTLYLEQQTPEVQNILCAALGTCQILHQRMIDVICMHVDIPEVENKGAV